MNEQAIQDAYKLFVEQGYGKSIDDFKKLISTNPDALNDSYNLFKSQGYAKSIDEYKGLMGVSSQPQPKVEVKKKEQPIPLEPQLDTPTPQGTMDLSLEDSLLASQKPKEKDYFTGAFGDVLRGLDKIVPIGIGDFVDDMSRSVAQGYRQGRSAKEADRLLMKDAKATPEQIQKFINANKNAQLLGPSAEMQNYQKIYEQEGKGFWGVVKGLANNPSVIPEVLTSSITAMATNTDALAAGAAAIGTGTAYGAGTGFAAGGVGAAPGAVAGAIASVPYAFGLASSVVEMGSTFGELLQEQLDGKEMTKDNVKAILENPEKLNSIRNKAIARGAIIGTVDAFTGKLASGVGAKIISKSAAKSVTGAVTRGAVVRATASGAAIEGAGGSLGEAAARGAIGQEMDVSEIALEGIAELPGGIRSTLQARLAKPSYSVNGDKVTAEEVDEIINTMNPVDLANTKIEIKNDYEGRQAKIQNKIVTHSVKEQVRQGNPDLNEASLDAITELEKQLKKLEGNTTQTGKDKAAAIRTQIKDIQENQLQEEVATEAIPGLEKELREAFDYEYYEENLNSQYDWQVDSAKEFLADPRAYFERFIKLYEELLQEEPNNEAYKDSLDIYEKKIAKWDEINNKYKTEQNAVQEQTTDESVLRTGEPQMGLQEVGEGDVQPEVVTSGTESQVLTNEEQERKLALENAFETPNTEDNTIAIGEEIIPIENAQAELDTLRSREVTSMEKQFGKEFPTAPTTDQGVSVTNKSAVDNIKTKTTDKGRVKVIEAAQRVLKTLKSVLPNFDIVLHDDEGSYNAAMESLGNKQGQGTRGNFAIKRDGSGRIDINLSRANSRTVAHEVAHAVMAKAFNGTPALYKGFRDRISKVLSESSNKGLMDFANNYTGDVTYEEYLAELTAVLEQQEGKIDTTTLQKIAAIINDIVSKITNGTFKPFEDIKDTKQVVDFFKSISESIRKGEEIDVSGMGAVKSFKAESKSQININKDEKQQGTAGPVAGNRLFNKPITKVKEIADGYYKRVFGTERPKFAGTRKLDEARGKRISDAFIAMKNNPNDPEVKAAYEALAKETLDQYKDFVKAGFTVEINNEEPYNNSQEMIDDLRNNKTIKIYSTESGFGSVPITEKERNNNPLLKDSGFKDINGNPLLINDVFRAIHDFYGHAELGNSFGVKGEENAWNVHARMFSPLARRAMTTETRGQNSYVNFSGVNERVEALREQARILREKGDEKGAQKIADKIYEEGKFADQKIGLLPEEFSQFDEQDAGDVTMRPEGLQERDQEVPISKSQIIGENAKMSAVVKNNLDKAKFLETQNETPLNIKIQTGCEVGKEGKWRYEIPDGKLKDVDINDLKKEIDTDGKVVRVAKLSDVFTAPDLFEAYPEAKDLKVIFKKLANNTRGTYISSRGVIEINQDLINTDRVKTDITVLHEIQHYIQEKELFENGSNPSYTRKYMNYMLKELKDNIDYYKDMYKNAVNKTNTYNPSDVKKLLDESIGKYKKLRELANYKDKKGEKPSAKRLATAYNIYYRIAGEVEARNVGNRMNLTMDEKRKSLLAETEDINREDQILFENKDQLYKNEVKQMEEEFPLSKSQVEVYHGTPHDFDKFSTSKIGTGEGNQAFGWGLYFTTLKSIAQHYANVLSGANNITVDGIGLKELLKKKGLEKNYKNATEDGNPNLNIWIKALTDVVADAKTKSDALQNINEKIKEVEDNIEYANQKIKDKEFLADADIKMTESSLRGLNRMLQDYNFLYDSIRDVEDYKADINRNVYEVSLHEGKTPNQYTWLEWDKPIKKDVRDRILERFIQENNISKKDLNKLIEDGIQYADVNDAFDIFDAMGLPINKGMVIQTLLDDEGKANGLRIYDTLRNAFENDQQKASEFLLRSGVDGVKYPAESVSRGATSEDARGFNYVVFDENAVTIKAVSKSQVDATNVVNKIVKDARAQGFSEESIRLFLESKGLDANDIKVAMQPEIPASKKATVTETMLAGFNALMTKIGSLINKNASDKDVIGLLKNDKAYINATDIQKEDMVRQVRAKLGLKQKSAPTADRLLGAIKNLAKITMTEKQALVKQIKDLSRGAKDAKKAIAEASKQLSKEVKTLVTEGKLTVNQAANVVRAFSKVNVLSQTSVDRFTEYMTKVFANAEYASKLNTAKSLRRDISKLSKNKDKNANLRDLAQQFAKINPSMVEDIDAYNDMASKIKEATKGSTIRLEKVTFAETVNIENASKYIDETIKAQDEMIRQERIAEIQDLMGIDASDFSAEDMLALLESEKPITKYNEGIVREAINNMFNIYSTLINETINQGRDPFTDEEVNFTTAQKDVVKRFMAMDLSLLNPKEALQAVDALANFLQNSSTARMESVLSKYTGNLNAQKIVDKGIVASPLMKYWSESFGRFLAEQTTNLNILFEKMFKGFNRGGMVEDASGVTKLKNNKSMAERESNNIVDKYISQFYKRKANGEAYNTESNSVERGLTAFMMRNVIGTEAEMKAEFNRRKKLIEQSIKVLSEGSEKEKTKSELYQKIYDKILKDSKSIQEVKDKTDPTNLEGIEYWNKEWADKYEQLSDVSLNVYNKVLDKDLNYTPDRFVKLESETGNVELDNEESAFHNNNGTIYKKETGVLMTAVKPETLPTNIDNGETNMYIDLSFDKNNANSMYDALVDINTAAPIRQIQAFLNSPNFKKIVPESKDAKLLKERIGLYVRNIRNKNPYSNDELSSAVRKLNKIASIGVGQALGGVFQPVKQMVPVAMNTIVNAGSLDVNAIFDSAKNGFINRSGYAISNRGIESQAQVESLNKLIDEASKTTGDKMFKAIEELNRKWLDIFLVKPDVAIARASWITYYEQSLKKQGIDTKGIDYNTHEVNEDAADYAQRMVDRQQNVSDADLAGKLFANKEATNQLFVKMLMPFASFRMNQAARVGADLGTLGNKASTVEDKKIAIKSLGGFAVEMVVFKMIAAGSGILLGTLAKMAMGKDEDDEEFKKRVNNIVKGQATGTFTDLFSPLPIADKLVQMGGNALIGVVQDAMKVPQEEQYNIFRVGKQDAIQGLGLFGIAADRATQLYEISKLASTGKYTDDFGKEKKISEKDQKALGYLIGPALLTNVGLAPVEVNSIIRNSIKDSKKATKTPEEKKQALENAENKLEQKERKISALEYLKKRATSQQMYNTIEEKLKEINATGEEKDKIEERNKEEKKLKDELLFDPRKGVKYDNESDMKKYSPSIYNRNFGVRSEWYRSHKIEEAVDKKVNEVIRKIKDREYKNRKP